MQPANQGQRGQRCAHPGKPWGPPLTLMVSSKQHPLHASRGPLPAKMFHPHLGWVPRGPLAEGHSHNLPPETLSGTDLLRGASSLGDEYAHPIVSHSQCQGSREKAGYSSFLETGREPAARKLGCVHPLCRAGGLWALKVLLTPQASWNLC